MAVALTLPRIPSSRGAAWPPASARDSGATMEHGRDETIRAEGLGPPEASAN